ERHGPVACTGGEGAGDGGYARPPQLHDRQVGLGPPTGGGPVGPAEQLRVRADADVIHDDQDDRDGPRQVEPRHPGGGRHRCDCSASPLRIALSRSSPWKATICSRTCAAKGSSLAPRMRAASRPALRAPPTETVATGTPAGICTIDSSESIPSRCWSGTGTPITGKGVREASMPGRWAAPPAPAM